MAKEFPKATEDLHKFAEEFAIVIQYEPGFFSDLYQLFIMLVDGRQARNCMHLAHWGNTRRFLQMEGH